MIKTRQILLAIISLAAGALAIYFKIITDNDLFIIGYFLILFVVFAVGHQINKKKSGK